jgi:transposase
MIQPSTSATTMTIGIDLGDRKSHVCVLDADGVVAEEGRIATTPEALRGRFEGVASTRIALEVGGHSAWVSEVLGELGHGVIVANARKLRMIFQRESKNDRLDAQQLARVARMDPKLLYPIQHRERSARADLAVLGARDALVTTRTRLVNHVHGVLKSFGHPVKQYAAPGFHRQVADQIPDELKRHCSRSWRCWRASQSRCRARTARSPGSRALLTPRPPC